MSINILMTDTLLFYRLVRPQLDKFVQILPQEPTLYSLEVEYFAKFRYMQWKSGNFSKLGCVPFRTTCPSPLNGRIIRVGAMTGPGRLIFTNNPDGSLKFGLGVYFETLQAASCIYNFTLYLQTGSRGKGTGYKLPNGTWTGALGDVLYGDVSLGVSIGTSVERHKIVDFSASMDRFTNTFYIQIPRKGSTWKSIYKPYNALVWAGIGISAIFIMLFLYIFQLIRHISFAKTEIWKILRIVLDQAAEATTMSEGRIVFLSWMIFSLLVGTGYRSKLTSFMTSPVSTAILPRTFSELAFSDYKLYYRFYGGMAYHAIITSKDPVYQAIGRRMVLVNSSEECITIAVLDERAACIDFTATAAASVSSNATLSLTTAQTFVQSEDSFVSVPMILAFRKGSPIITEFNHVVLQTMASGLFDHWSNRDLDRYRILGSRWLKSQQENKVRLRLEELAQASTPKLAIKSFHGVAMFCGLGLIAASFSLVFETFLLNQVAGLYHFRR